MNNKEDSLKEKFKLALISTAKVISDDYKINDKNIDKKSDSSNENLLKINSLSNRNDFVKLRAKADSAALKKNFLTKKYSKKTYLKIHHANRFMKLLKRLDMKY